MITRRPLIPPPHDTIWSDDRTFRYAWKRVWDKALPVCNFIMLNPSVANEFNTDPTVRKCLSFSRYWGCGTLIVTNLFAYVSTDPGALYDDELWDPVGPLNDAYIEQIATASDITVAAWGTHGGFCDRGSVVTLMLARKTCLQCLGTTKEGFPRHPLYVPYSQERIPFAR